MRFVHIIIVVLVFSFGCLFGFFVNNFPLIRWNQEIKIYECFQVLTTLFIALAIPFFIKRWIDNGRVIRTLLNEEAKDISNEAKKINDKFLECYNRGSIDDNDKRYITASFTQLENRILAFENSTKTAFNSKYNNGIQDFKISYFGYWHAITDGDLMSNTFTSVSVEYFNFHTGEYYEFLNALRKFNITIQRG